MSPHTSYKISRAKPTVSSVPVYFIPKIRVFLAVTYRHKRFLMSGFNLLNLMVLYLPITVFSFSKFFLNWCPQISKGFFFFLARWLFDT